MHCLLFYPCAEQSAEPRSPVATRATRPLPVTRGSSASTTGPAPQVKTELGSPFSGNESENERGANTSSAASHRGGDTSYNASESEGDFSMDKAPRSLRGITTIADPNASIPSGFAADTSGASSAYDSPYLASHQQFAYSREGDQHFIHPPGYLMHARRHTVPDASRGLFAGSSMNGADANAVS